MATNYEKLQDQFLDMQEEFVAEKKIIPKCTMEDIDILRAALHLLTEPIEVLGEDGIRYTFCPPRWADGAVFEHAMHHIVFTTTMYANGAKHRTHRGFLYPLEAMVYAMERAKIIADILSNLDRAPVMIRLKEHSNSSCNPFPEDFGDDGDFIEDFRKAIDRTNEIKGLKPKIDKSVKLEIKKVRDIWWLFHREWMPLCFDNFEEAALFAKRYIKATGGRT